MGAVGERHTHAHRELHLDTTDHDLAAEGEADAFGELERGVLVDAAVAEHHELVAADAGDHVRWSGGVCHAVGHLGEQGVAHVVAGVVVDVLELVEVEEQQGHMAAGAADAVECIGGGAQQQDAVRQAGEPVVGGLAHQLGLHVVACRDVADDAAPVLDDALVIAMDDEVDVEDPLEAVGAAEADLARPLRRVRRREQLAGHLVADGLQQAPHRRVADEIDGVVDPEQHPGRLVRVDGRTVAVEDDDRIGRRLDHAEQTLEQQPLADGLGVVDGHARVPLEASEFVAHRAGVHPHPQQSPVAVPHTELDREVGLGVGCLAPDEFGRVAVGRVCVRPRSGARRRHVTTESEGAERCVGRGESAVPVGLEDRDRQRRQRLIDG